MRHFVVGLAGALPRDVWKGKSLGARGAERPGAYGPKDKQAFANQLDRWLSGRDRAVRP